MKCLKLTLKAWPMIAVATIGLCFLTQLVAGWFGITLPDQANIEIVRKYLVHAFDSKKHFGVAAFLVAQVLVLMPVIEELVFRWGLFKAVVWVHGKMTKATEGTKRMNVLFVSAVALVSSVLFSAAHYIDQPFPDAAFVALAFFGCAQCWLYRKTNLLWCSMLNHTLFNLTNLILLFLIPQA